MEADCVGRRPQKSGDSAGHTADREGGMGSPPLGDEEDDHSFYSTPLNSPVPSTSLQSMKHYFDDPKGLIRQGQSRAIAEEERKRRMRWVAQMSEYWPIDYIGAMSRKDMLQALEHFKDETPSSSNDLEFKDASLTSQQVSAVRGRSRPEECNAEQVNLVTTAGRRTPSQHNLELRAPMKGSTRSGQIILIGSGPGHPGLLTAMALRILTSQQTDLVLSDKLVPASILSLIDPSTTLHIARKFPGNAEGAQSELISLAIEAALQGKTVVRLKQGDPFIYGRGGEEVLAFKQRGVAVSVVPGISSAIAAPLLLGMPVTQRGAADTLTLCTGVGRGGKQVGLPGYERGRSLVILMGVARIGDVIKTLCHGWSSEIGASHRLEDGETQAKVTGIRSGDPYPPYLPIAVIERASSSDQRSISSTLDRIEEAIQDCGEQRPPGMMLVGWAVLALEGGPKGNVDILDEGSALSDDPNELERRDRQRVDRWLGSSKYIVKEGLDEFYSKDSVHAFTARSSKDVNQPNEQHTRSHEWAPPRYGTHGGLYGGWTPGESGLTGSQQQHC
jgi:uroporphyrin-III C-methyltransferase